MHFGHLQHIAEVPFLSAECADTYGPCPSMIWSDVRAKERRHDMTARPTGEYRMTLRVYTVTASGKITGDSGIRYVAPVEHLDSQSGFPPCRCPRCRALLMAARASQ